MTSRERQRQRAAADLTTLGATRMPFARQEWLAPTGLRIARDGGGLKWLPRESLERGGVMAPSPGLLEDFLALADAPAARVLDFAGTHGVLGVVDPARRHLSPGDYAQWHYRRGAYAREPLSEWHAAATQAKALLDAAARLRQGRLLTDDERVPVLAAAWPEEAQATAPTLGALHLTDAGETAFLPAPDPDTWRRQHLLELAQRTLDNDRTQLGWAITTWLHDVGAQLVFTWPSGSLEPELTIGGERAWGCLAAVVVQVALACARAETTRTCDGCGGLHAPRRAPRPGQRSFCQVCREAGMPVRVAKRDARARARANMEVSDG